MDTGATPQKPDVSNLLGVAPLTRTRPAASCVILEGFGSPILVFDITVTGSGVSAYLDSASVAITHFLDGLSTPQVRR